MTRSKYELMDKLVELLNAMERAEMDPIPEFGDLPYVSCTVKGDRVNVEFDGDKWVAPKEPIPKDISYVVDSLNDLQRVYHIPLEKQGQLIVGDYSIKYEYDPNRLANVWRAVRIS